MLAQYVPVNVFAADGDDPVDTCEKKCTEDNANVWCDVCGFEYIKYCGTDELKLELEGDSTVAQTDHEAALSQLYSYGVYADGNLIVSSTGNLYWFATQVNGGSTSIHGKLTTDIVVNTGVLVKGERAPETSGFRLWIPIGNNSKRYTGTFDGGEYTISGLYFNYSSSN